MFFSKSPFHRRLPRNRGYRLKQILEREQKLRELEERNGARRGSADTRDVCAQSDRDDNGKGAD